MTTQDLVTITATAIATATLTVLTFWSGPLDAGSDGRALAPKITQPKLIIRGVELTLAAADGQTFKAGDEPAFELQAVNTTGDPADLTVRVAMTASSPQDALSRAIRMPSLLWEHPQAVSLQPHESKRITLPVATKLPANSLISVSLQKSEPVQPSVAAGSAESHAPAPRLAPAAPGIVAMNLSTVSPAPRGTVVR